MKISIIVPVYNVEQYIKECFDSIAAQTYKGDMECIFVDDCGQDNSVAVLEKLITDYHGAIKFSIVHHEHNKGLSGARNTGIKKASGDYLYFLDSDDSITSDCIEKLTALAEKYPGVDIVQGSTKSRMNWLQMGWKKLPEYSRHYSWIKKTMLKRYIIPMTAWNKLICRSFVLNHNLFFAEGIIHEDEVWNFMLAKYVHRIAFCETLTYIYRENDGGIMKSSANKINAIQPAIKLMLANLSKKHTAYELECIKSILAERKGIKISDCLQGFSQKKIKLIKVLFDIIDEVNNTSKKTFVGIYVRIIKLIIVKYIDIIWKK